MKIIKHNTGKDEKKMHDKILRQRRTGKATYPGELSSTLASRNKKMQYKTR